MIIFRKSVSWSKFKLAITCPLALQRTLKKEFAVISWPNEAQVKGKIIQKVWELYFNNKMNLHPRGKDISVLVKILYRVMASQWLVNENLIMKTGSTEVSVREELLRVLTLSYGIVKKMNLLEHEVQSEVKLMSVFMGFRMFGMLDFLVRVKGGVMLFDGKGHSEENADERQLLYYALALHAAQEKIIGGGFIYWQHQYRPMDLSPYRLKKFVDEEFAQGRKIFERLKIGVEELEAYPSSENCFFCNWKRTCDKSVYRKQDVEALPQGVVATGLGDPAWTRKSDSKS